MINAMVFTQNVTHCTLRVLRKIIKNHAPTKTTTTSNVNLMEVSTFSASSSVFKAAYACTSSLEFSGSILQVIVTHSTKNTQVARHHLASSSVV